MRRGLGDVAWLGVFASVAAISVVASAPAYAKTTYVTFDVPRAAQTYAFAINNNSTVAGNWIDDAGKIHGYVRGPDGTISAFDPPNSQGTQIGGMNDDGLVVGSYGYTINGIEYVFGFWRTPDGTITSYDAPGSDNDTALEAVNNKGTIAGYYCESPSEPCPAFYLTSKGKFVTFGVDGAIATYPSSINDEGVIAGFYEAGDGHSEYLVYGFERASDGTITTFTPSGAEYTFVYNVNSKDTVVGRFLDSNNEYHSFLGMLDGTVLPIDDPLGVKGTGSRGLNDKGVAVGFFLDSNGRYHGFGRSRSGEYKSFDPKRSSATDPTAINDNGVIAGSYTTKDNVRHGFIRFPENSGERRGGQK